MAAEMQVVPTVAVPPGIDGRRAFVADRTARASPIVAPAGDVTQTRAAAAAQVPVSTAMDAREMERLHQAIQALEQKLASTRTALQFRVDRDANRMVVSVVDAEDGKVLRQIPSEVALRIAHQLDRQAGDLLEAFA